MAQATQTVDHEEIKHWVEERGGSPAKVKAVSGKSDLLRINFPGYSGEDSLEEISWEEFFDQFEKHNLAFLYQDEPDSRFNKLIARGE